MTAAETLTRAHEAISLSIGRRVEIIGYSKIDHVLTVLYEPEPMEFDGRLHGGSLRVAVFNTTGNMECPTMDGIFEEKE